MTDFRRNLLGKSQVALCRLSLQRGLFYKGRNSEQQKVLTLEKGKIRLLEGRRRLTSNFAGSNLTGRIPFEKRSTQPAFLLETGQTLSYGHLHQLTGRYAAILHRWGLQPRDRLVAKVSKRPENVALYLATLQLGAVYVPVNPDYTKSEIERLIEDCLPKVFVTDNTEKDHYMKQRVSLLIGEEKLLRSAAATDPEYDCENVRSKDVACLCYTSGTTGQPKGAMLTHGNLTSNAESLIELWRMTERDTLLHALPIYHIHGLFVATHCSLLTGGSMLYLPKFSVQSVINCLPGCTVLMGIPTYYSRLVSSKDFGPNLIKNMRLFTCGSAPLSVELWEQFHQRTGHKILERYGMTEGIMICSNPYNPDERIPGTVGKPLPNVEIRISDGVLQYRGPNVFRGYWGDAERTQQEFSTDGYFISGDLAEMDANGYVKILGRKKELIITGGLNVYPKEIEDLLAKECSHLLTETAVIGIAHDDYGEAVVAVCVPRPNVAPDTNTILSKLRQHLAGYKIPKKLVFVDSLPRNSMGKIQKIALRKKFGRVFVDDKK